MGVQAQLEQQRQERELEKQQRRNTQAARTSLNMAVPTSEPPAIALSDSNLAYGDVPTFQMTDRAEESEVETDAGKSEQWLGERSDFREVLRSTSSPEPADQMQVEVSLPTATLTLTEDHVNFPTEPVHTVYTDPKSIWETIIRFLYGAANFIMVSAYTFDHQDMVVALLHAAENEFGSSRALLYISWAMAESWVSRAGSRGSMVGRAEEVEAAAQRAAQPVCHFVPKKVPTGNIKST